MVVKMGGVEYCKRVKLRYDILLLLCTVLLVIWRCCTVRC